MTDQNYIQGVFDAQKAHQYEVGKTSYKERKAKLKALKKALVHTYRAEIQAALYADFQKPAADTDLNEIYVVVNEINHTLRNLKKWMADRWVGTPLALLGSSSHVRYEPKGVCLIIAPWNYPLNLSFGPLVSAIAAGNTAIIKPSEMTPHTSAVVKKITEAVFDPKEVCVIEGAVETSTALLALPFNHIFFTGSPAIGKVVMAAAAKNLSSVTLELGGKSPAIVDETANIPLAAKRLVWGKFINTGQTCVTNDHIWVHEQKLDELLSELQKVTLAFFGENPEQSASYARVVHQQHAEKMRSYITDALQKGARIVMGGEVKGTYVAPTILTNIADNALLNQEEIFGPVMPVKTFKELSEVTEALKKEEKPLALYIFSRNRKNIEFIQQHTRAGATGINNNVVHFFNNDLPFGGSNNSGIGKSHGHAGFLEFSNERAVYKQVLPGAVELLLNPPYTNFKRWLIDFTVKYL